MVAALTGIFLAGLLLGSVLDLILQPHDENESHERRIRARRLYRRLKRLG
jgi:hypothetical protein